MVATPTEAGRNVRLPLLVGTTAIWASARVALSLFPGIAFCAAGVAAVIALLAAGVDGDAGVIAAAPAILGVLLLVYAWFYAKQAWKTRASDVILENDGLRFEGGRRSGERIPWSAFTAPYAEVERAKASRLVLYRLPLVALGMVFDSDTGEPSEKLRVWRLWIHCEGRRELLAQAERPIEGASLKAAAASIQAVLSERAVVAHTPSVAAKFARCEACHAPLVPDDASEVVCPYCSKRVPLPDDVRTQAAGMKALAGARERTSRRVARLLDQPGPTGFNLLLLLATVLMIAAWPLGWSLVAQNVVWGQLHLIDALFVLMPLFAVLGGFFFVRAWLVDRGALLLLSLGYGALAPARKGEPSSCRRCEGPLPPAGLGGVVQCRYCGAENIEGMDLRPVVDELRGKNENFDEALGKRRRERLKWGGLAVVALFALAGWTQATVAYARARPTMEFKKPPPPVARAPAPAPERPPGSLTVLCTPECSEVVIDGVPLGPSPIVKRAAAAGVHDVRVSAPNGAKKNYAVVVVSGETHKFRIEMDK